MHICILSADYTVKPVLSGHSKKKTNYCLMQVKSIADAPRDREHSAILLTFIKLALPLRSLFRLFLSGNLTHVLLYLHLLPIVGLFTIKLNGYRI